LTVQELVSALGLHVAAGASGLGREVRGGYASDLLSCVLAGAREGNVWVTLQAHPNVVAVADLRELSCVIISEGTQPDPETLARADERGLPLLRTEDNTYVTVSRLVQLGIR